MILLLGVMGSLVYQVLFLVGMNDTTASNTGLLVATVPLWTAVIASLSGIDRIRSSAWVGLTVAFAGTAVIALEGGDLDLAVDHLRGNAMVLGAMLLWAAFTVLSKPALAMMSPIRLAYLTSLVVMPGHVALALSHLEPVVEGRLSAGAWESIAYSGLLSTGLAYVLWNDSVRKVGPSHTAICNNLVPVVAVLASWVWLGESITLTQIVGGAMILGGLVAMRRTRKYGV
jgi:drug/metabolite transporter (DMT)-like permease